MRHGILRAGRASKIALAGAFLFAANYGWATFSACTTAATLGSFGVPGSNLDGCKASDENFSNFEVGVDGGALAAMTATTGGYDSILTTAASLAPVATYTNNVAGTGVGSWTNLSGNGNQQLFQWVNAVNNAAPTPPPGSEAYFTKVALTGTETFTTGTAGELLTITQDICAGNVAACTATTTGVIIVIETFTSTGGTGTTAGTPSWTCNATTGSGPLGTCVAANSGVVNLEHITGITIDTTIASTHNNPIVVNFVDSYTEGDIPEPSTFILMGSALAGVAALRFRKRKLN
jgi:hypothetical protein